MVASCRVNHVNVMFNLIPHLFFEINGKKKKYSEHLVMSCPDSNKLAFIAFVKTDGDKQWKAVDDTFPIDPACLHRTPERGLTPAPGSPMSQNPQQ